MERRSKKRNLASVRRDEAEVGPSHLSSDSFFAPSPVPAESVSTCRSMVLLHPGSPITVTGLSRGEEWSTWQKTKRINVGLQLLEKLQ